MSGASTVDPEVEMGKTVLGAAWVLMLLAGCSGPRKGNVYGMAVTAILYLDEGVFRDAADRWEAGLGSEGEDQLGLNLDGKLKFLDAGSEVKVIEPVRGGAKVIVLTGKETGTIGWMLTKHLQERSPR